ncbi:MAG: glycosyltransferase family 4 protein [Gallionellaceae bacterium]|nr:glycosyltransferase family 4 protein [Gallionellaceae bacterium]
MLNQVITSAADISAEIKPKLQLLYVVRRYGSVGGMERYVWELTHQLQQLGHDVTVLCERCYALPAEGITVCELGEVAPRPRWLSALRFSQRVQRWLDDNPNPDRLIHSHERISSHHITTFHGSAFATVLEKPWWRLISLRVLMWLYLERRELSKAQYIVPNSEFTKQQLAHYYPKLAHKLTEPIVPGVAPLALRKPRGISKKGGVVGFVGVEWKRKGLPLAVAAFKKLRVSRPKVKFVVVGPSAEDVQHLFSELHGAYVLKEWCNQVDFAEFDVLIHPAQAEPYGMVITEAMAAKVPVVVSDVCGASVEVMPKAGEVLPINASVDEWAKALERQLNRAKPVPQFKRGWQEVAQDYEKVFLQC